MSLTKQELMERRKYVGASEIAAVLGVCMRGTTPAQLWLEKTDEREPEEEVDTPASRRGVYLEAAAASCYEDTQGVKLARISPRVHPQYEFIRASADRVVIGSLETVIERGWEGKSVAAHMAEDFGDEGTDHVPVSYLLQCAQGMACYGVDTWDLTALIGGISFEFRHYRIHRNEDLERTIIESAKSFWRYVTSREAPPTSWWKDQEALLRRRHPKGLGMVKRIEPTDFDANALVSVFREQRNALAAAEELYDKTATLVKALIGDADKIQGPTWTIPWSNVQGSSKTDWKAIANELLIDVAPERREELLKLYTKVGEPTRRFGPPNWSKGYEAVLPQSKKTKEIA